MSETLFTFANEREWPMPRLGNRFHDLDSNNQNHLSEERRETVQREMCHIAFEGLQRQREVNERAAEVGMLEYKYDTFTSQENTGKHHEATQWKKSGMQ